MDFKKFIAFVGLTELSFIYWFNWFVPFEVNWLINLVQFVVPWQKKKNETLERRFKIKTMFFCFALSITHLLLSTNTQLLSLFPNSYDASWCCHKLKQLKTIFNIFGSIEFDIFRISLSLLINCALNMWWTLNDLDQVAHIQKKKLFKLI